MMNKQPLVSVNVVMYNSSKYIVETLESIKAQTYQNIELIMSDDKSTDNTVQICEDWISNNKDRFFDYKIIVPEKNTGVSGNVNRAFCAATGEWIKEIAGDDILLPNCIEDCVNFVKVNPDAKYVFGRMTGFGSDKDQIEYVLKRFDYSFFSLTKEKQLHRLLYEGNCIPAPAAFYNKEYMLDLRFECDERIPLMEDWPKWIKLLQLGVKFHYLPNEIVSYRVEDGLSTSFPSENYYRTFVLMNVLCRYPEWLSNDKNEAVKKIVEEHMFGYYLASDYKKKIDVIINSNSYKIGHVILSPLRWMCSLFQR